MGCERGTHRTAGNDRDRREREIRGGHAQTGCHADARAADDRRLDQQQAHGADLDRDDQADREAGEQGGGRVHGRLGTLRTAETQPETGECRIFSVMDRVDSEILGFSARTEGSPGATSVQRSG